MEDNIECERYLKRFDEILDEMEQKMLSQNITDNITKNFIECMIPHHQAAIYMCQNLLEYTNYMPLEEIAKSIIKTQTRGIEQMRKIYETTCGYCNSTMDVEAYMERYLAITKNMIDRMRNSRRTTNINLNFVSEMIPHHEGAIGMCNNLLQYYIDPRLRRVANSIIKEQSEGVMQLKQIELILYSKNVFRC